MSLTWAFGLLLVLGIVGVVSEWYGQPQGRLWRRLVITTVAMSLCALITPEQRADGSLVRTMLFGGFGVNLFISLVVWRQRTRRWLAEKFIELSRH